MVSNGMNTRGTMGFLWQLGIWGSPQVPPPPPPPLGLGTRGLRSELSYCERCWDTRLYMHGQRKGMREDRSCFELAKEPGYRYT